MDVGKKGERVQRANVWARALPHHRWAAGSTLDTLSSQSSPSLQPFPASLLYPSPLEVNTAPFIHSPGPHSHFEEGSHAMLNLVLIAMLSAITC